MEGQTNDLRIVNPQRCGDVAFACWFSFEPNTLLRQLTGMVEEELVISPELGHVPEAEWSPLFGCAHVCVCVALRFQEIVSYSVRRGHGGCSPSRANKATVLGWKRYWTQYFVPATSLIVVTLKHC